MLVTRTAGLRVPTPRSRFPGDTPPAQRVAEKSWEFFSAGFAASAFNVSCSHIFTLLRVHISSRLRVSGIQIHMTAASRNAAPATAKAAKKPRDAASEPTMNGAAALAIRPTL
jgi:hypothetical protein